MHEDIFSKFLYNKLQSTPLFNLFYTDSRCFSIDIFINWLVSWGERL